MGAPSQEVVEHYSTPSRPGGDFRSRILEMMRWAVRCCHVIPDDDGAFNESGRAHPAASGHAHREHVVEQARLSGPALLEHDHLQNAAQDSAISKHQSLP